jgi:acyl carrier protein
MPSTMIASVSERLLQFVRQTFAGRVPADAQPGPTSPLFSSQVIDSMGVVELLAFIERAFGVSLDLTMDDLSRLDTVERLAAAIAPSLPSSSAR